MEVKLKLNEKKKRSRKSKSKEKTEVKKNENLIENKGSCVIESQPEPKSLCDQRIPETPTVVLNQRTDQSSPSRKKLKVIGSSARKDHIHFDETSESEVSDESESEADDADVAEKTRTTLEQQTPIMKKLNASKSDIPLPITSQSKSKNDTPNAYSFSQKSTPIMDQQPNRRVDNTPAWIVAAMSQPKSSNPSTPFKPLPPSTPCPFPPVSTPKGKVNQNVFQPEPIPDVDDAVVEMGKESILYSRPKRKYEVIVSQSHLDNNAQVTNEVSERYIIRLLFLIISSYLRVPVPHLYSFKVGDCIAYRTLSLSEETWNPIISDILEVSYHFHFYV